jgi:hypothetical protein
MGIIVLGAFLTGGIIAVTAPVLSSLYKSAILPFPATMSPKHLTG